MLQPLDQTVEDINPLSASLREMSGDLRQPTGFQHVYHVPGRDDLFMRISGGVYAIFPESAYVAGRNGKTVSMVPANTVFYIGFPAKLPAKRAGELPGAGPEAGQSQLSASPQRLQTELTSRAQVAQEPGAVQTMIDTKMWDVDSRGMPTGPMDESPLANESNAAAISETAFPPGEDLRVRTIVNDSRYRARRLEQLLQQAANAASRRAP